MFTHPLSLVEADLVAFISIYMTGWQISYICIYYSVILSTRAIQYHLEVSLIDLTVIHCKFRGYYSIVFSTEAIIIPCRSLSDRSLSNTPYVWGILKYHLTYKGLIKACRCLSDRSLGNIPYVWGILKYYLIYKRAD